MRTAELALALEKRCVNTHSETKGQDTVILRSAQSLPDEAVQAFCTKVEPGSSVKSVWIGGQHDTHNFCPSSCFCSSVRRYLVWVTSNLPSPSKVTRQTRRFVPPRSSARYSPVSVPSGHYDSSIWAIKQFAQARTHAKDECRDSGSQYLLRPPHLTTHSLAYFVSTCIARLA